MVAPQAEFSGDKIAGTVNMTAVTINIKMKPVIYGIID